MSFSPSLSLLILGVIIIGGGLVRLDRLDRLRMDSNRQHACRWHQWQIREEGALPVCALCGKRGGAPTLSRDPAHDSLSPGSFFP